MNYKWSQDADSISLRIPISKDIRCKDISVELQTNSIIIYIEGDKIFEEELFGTIIVDKSIWGINNDEKREIVIKLVKKNIGEWLFPIVLNI